MLLYGRQLRTSQDLFLGCDMLGRGLLEFQGGLEFLLSCSIEEKFLGWTSSSVDMSNFLFIHAIHKKKISSSDLFFGSSVLVLYGDIYS